jgi:hypothetical protein
MIAEGSPLVKRFSKDIFGEMPDEFDRRRASFLKF